MREQPDVTINMNCRRRSSSPKLPRHSDAAWCSPRAFAFAVVRHAAFALLLMLAAPALASDDAAANLILPAQGVLGKFEQRGGENLYRAICQGCHMPDAHGAKGAAEYPALAANPRLAAAAYPVAMVLAGRRAMPAFGASLSDEQIAEVVNYVRSHFDNRYTDTLTPEDVARLRTPTAAPAR